MNVLEKLSLREFIGVDYLSQGELAIVLELLSETDTYDPWV